MDDMKEIENGLNEGLGTYRFECPFCKEIVKTYIDREEWENYCTERICIHCGNKVIIPITKNIEIIQPIQ